MLAFIETSDTICRLLQMVDTGLLLTLVVDLLSLTFAQFGTKFPVPFILLLKCRHIINSIHFIIYYSGVS